MQLFGVINASPDSLHEASIVRDEVSARARAEYLLANGAFAFDVGGQGSTFAASEADPAVEWERLVAVLPALVSYGVPISVDTWRPSVARLALEAGVSWLNAADGLQSDEMLALAAEFECPIVLPFLNGPDPLQQRHIDAGREPIEVIAEFFEAMLDRADRFGIRERCVIDPGTGFAPHDWPWEERYLYQKRVYSNLGVLRRFGLPLYIPLPWRDTPQHLELLDIAVGQEPEYGRAHYPERIRAAEAAWAKRSVTR